MKIEKNDKYTVLKPKSTTNFQKFYRDFNTKIDTLKKEHLILDLSELSLKLEELIQFKDISEKKVGSGTSFVVINTSVEIDEIPDEIIVVPTFQEAIDMIEMDEMTRSLDF